MTSRQRSWLLPPAALMLIAGILIGRGTPSPAFALVACLPVLAAMLIGKGLLRFAACLVLSFAVGTAAGSLAWHPSRSRAHLQSWFIGLTPAVFLSDWFAHFIHSIRPVPDKSAVCELYEIGLSRKLEQHAATVYAPYTLKGKSIYDQPLRLFRQGFPFVKKASFTRHGGNMGAELSRVVERMDPLLRQAVVSDYERLHGEGSLRILLSRNPLRMLWRYLRYVKKKILGKR